MAQALVILLAVAAMAMYLLRRFSAGDGLRDGQRNRPAKRSHDHERHFRNPYQSVSIKCGSSACRAARSRAGIRYLVGDTPLLPLEGCDVQHCDCRYVHHADRRSTLLDRRRGSSITTDCYTLDGRQERRTRPGRRQTDEQWAVP